MTTVADRIRDGVDVEQLFRALAAGLTASLAYLAADRGVHPTGVDSTVDDDARDDVIARAQERLGLTAREAEVLTLVARHFTNREIATALVISVRTAEHHVAHILRKLGAPNRRAAVAIVRDLVAPPAPALAVVSDLSAARARAA